MSLGGTVPDVGGDVSADVQVPSVPDVDVAANVEVRKGLIPSLYYIF